MQTIKQFVSPLLATMLVSAPVLAQDDSASAGLSLSTDEGVSASSSADQGAPAANEEAPAVPDSREGSYMSRYRPESNLLEIGMFFGAMFPSEDHNLHNEDIPQTAYDPMAFEAGVRLGYYPVSFLGIEAEAALMPTDTDVDKAAAILYSGRGHLVGQLPYWSITPFVLIGGGALGTNSGRLGNDMDPALHFGAGVKIPANDTALFRLDVRDTMSQKNDEDDGVQTHHPEVLLGLTYTLGRTKKPCPSAPPDADADGISDVQDQCPGQPGEPPTGCPPPADSDGDSVIDANDKCPTQAGPAPEGCPPPPDTDGDGLIDANDKCPNEPSKEPDGCPNLDPDGDGIPVDKDKCPDKAENKNGFEDTDGCPDELPEVVKKFNGVMKGIQFEFGKAAIRPVSRPVLDDAAKTLVEYPDLKILITGHTDNVGERDRNLKLSGDRADAVKAYLVGKGVSADRIATKGAGPDEPVADNKKDEGRAQNRRIAFSIVTQ